MAVADQAASSPCLSLAIYLLCSSASAFAPMPRPGTCDMTNGRWVWDWRRPKYTGYNCPFIRDVYNCDKNRRPDKYYQKYAWQPYGCFLNTFDPRKFASMMRGKNILLVGDSLMRNFQESLLCLLHTQYRIQAWSGQVGSVRLAGNIVFTPYGQFRILSLGSSYLVQARKRPVSKGQPPGYDIDLDKPDSTWTRALPGVNVIVFISGHWFVSNPPGRNAPNRYFINGHNSVFDNLGAYHTSLMTVLDYLRSVQYNGLPYALTFSASHKLPGWFKGGDCKTDKILTSHQVQLVNKIGSAVQYHDVLVGAFQGTLIRIIDVTRSTTFRADGHLQMYYVDKKKPNQGEDCTHWCVPGVTDSWIDLFHLLLRQEPSLRGFQ